jgi:hypothetical protein
VKHGVFTFCFGVFLTLSGCLNPIQKNDAGNTIPNFHSVVPGIARGGQPASDEDWQWLVAHGYSNVVKLNEGSEGEDTGAIRVGMTVRAHPISLEQQLLFGPNHADFQQAILDITPGTFIHCGSDSRTKEWLVVRDDGEAGGNDRTGLLVGEYRVQVCGWSKIDAYVEMKKLGYHPELIGLESYWIAH